MLKREITYEDFNGETQTDTYYFYLSKPEIIDLELKYEGGLESFLQRITDAKDYKSLVSEFKQLILLTVGQKSDDGKRFVKTDQIRTDFASTEAYNVLFMELATDDNKAIEFIEGVIPKDMSKALAEQKAKEGRSMTPPPPPSPTAQSHSV